MLIINSYHPGHEWTDDQVLGIRQALKENGYPLEIHTEYMDTKRYLSDSYLADFHQFLKAKYQETPLALLITTDDNAYQFMLRYRKEMFSGIPVVFCGVNHFKSSQLEGHENITGVVERLDIEGNFRLAMRLHPEAKELVVITDSSATGRGNRRFIELLLQEEEFPIPIRLMAEDNELTLQEMLSNVEDLPPDRIIHLVDFYRDRQGLFISPEEVMELIQARSNNPVYAPGSFYLGHGIVGGKLVVAEGIGRAAGQIGLRILRGQSADSIPVNLESPATYMFDYNQLQIHGIHPGSLPPGSIIINKPQGFYNRYKRLVWAVIIIFLGMTALIITLLVNIGRRIRAERQLRENEERLRILFDQAADAIYVVNPRGCIEQVNEQACRSLGYSREELLQMNVIEVDADIPTEEDIKSFFQTLSPRVPQTLNTFHMRKNGTTFPVEVTIALLELPDGIHVIGIARDVTERKKMEQERQRLEDQLRQSQKMEAIGQLTGGVAHDFNNLLQVINGTTDLAMEDLEDNHPTCILLEEVLKAGERAAQLVSQLLQFSRRQIMRPEPLDLNKVVEDLLKMIRRVIGEHIRLDFNSAPELKTIHADRGMIEQALMNLCVNARDAMPRGGVLTISTSQVSLDARFCRSHEWAKPGEYILLEVVDTGTGMDQETLQHIYEPFFTTKETGKGTGLGLATVYGIVRQHEGMINVKSRLDQGTTFSVYLPVSGEPATQVQPETETTTGGGTETILLAEDDEMVRTLATNILQRAGYTVLTANNGIEAVQQFKTHNSKIDLVILDVVMPGMGGRQAYEQMLTLRPDLQALFASGYSESAIDTNFVLNEGLTLLQKPFAPSDLLLAVRGILDH